MKVLEQTKQRAAKRKRADEHIETPKEYKCPISMELMDDPVVCSDGHTYNRTSIEELFRLRKYISPITREKLNKIMTPNITLRKVINDYIENIIP